MVALCRLGSGLSLTVHAMSRYLLPPDIVPADLI
jgi:hypothetical protein